MVTEVMNTVCGANGCSNPANERLVTKLGFAARFCHSCADLLTIKGLATKEDKGKEKNDAGAGGPRHQLVSSGENLHGVIRKTT